MKIFNKSIFGTDADYFMALSCEEKKQWIRDNTNVTNEDLICEFVKNANRGKDECDECKKKKANGNTSARNAKQAKSVKSADVAKDGSNGSVSTGTEAEADKV